MPRLFRDGFESGDLSAWDVAVTDGGNLSAEIAAALHGVYGGNYFMDDANQLYVEDHTPNVEKIYSCRFYLNPNALSLTGDIDICIGWKAGFSAATFIVWLREDSGFNIFVEATTDSGFDVTAVYPITDAKHCIEIAFKASSVPGANDGTTSLYIGKHLKETLTGLDTDTMEISNLTLGTVFTPGATTGTFFLDSFDSRNDSNRIGCIERPEFLLNMMR